MRKKMFLVVLILVMCATLVYVFNSYYENDTPPQYAGMVDGENIAENWFLSKLIWYMDGI